MAETKTGELMEKSADALRTVASSPMTSRMAVSSLVLGCLGPVACGITGFENLGSLTCGIMSLVGLALGIIGLVRINKSNGQLGGKGVALAGTIVSAAFLLFAVILPALATVKPRAFTAACMNNVRQLSLGLLMCASDNKGRFPSGTNWCDALSPYLKRDTTFLCVVEDPAQRCHYAFNASLAGREMKDIPAAAQTVLIFETDGGWNVTGGRELLLTRPRHNGGCIVGFADGHAELVRPAGLEKLRWEP